MDLKSVWLVLASSLLLLCVDVVFLQGTGSGTNGNLRLCIVEGRGAYKRGSKFCPTLDKENSGVECVIGTDRLDCLRRIHKGTVDFGVFSPEDLIAAQWAKVEVLVVNELRLKQRPFARSVVAVVNNRVLKDMSPGSTVTDKLRGANLCHPATDVDDLRPLSEAVTRYMESLVTANRCDPNLSLVENRLNATAAFFNRACMAGPWVADATRDAELKRRYPSLCAACAQSCSQRDRYWGDVGALSCLFEQAGDVTWADQEDVRLYLENNPSAGANQYSLLCRDGTTRALNASEPCVWLHQPWSVIVAKRKAVEAVSRVTASLTNSTVLVDGHWRGALARLLEVRQALGPPRAPAPPPEDYLDAATGYREAYSQHGCNPPRHITICTHSLLANNKCEWLAEAGAVYGVLPPLQCVVKDTSEQCMAAVRDGVADVTIASGDWLVPATRNYSLSPILHEATPIVNEMITISAYVRNNSGINKISDLRNKRAAFPSFDGVAWHSALRYLSNNQKETCRDVANTFFGSICAPGVENHNFTAAKKEQYTKSCYKEGDNILNGELQALRSLVEGKSDVAFINRTTYTMYKGKHIEEPWAKELVELSPVCPEENKKYCFLSWTNVGHVFASNDITDLKRREIVNALTSLDQLFGNRHAHQLMFSMYGPYNYNHQIDVLFHNNTKALINDQMYNMRPYSEIPLSFELGLKNQSGICTFADFSYGVKFVPAVFLIWALVFSVILVN